MAPSAYIVSAAVMGLLAVAVLLATQGGGWRRDVGVTERPNGKRRLAADRRVWLLGFVLLAIAAAVVPVVALGSGSPGIYLVGVGTAAVAFLVGGVYLTATARGHPHSHAVGEAVVTLGAVALVAVVGWLLLTAGT